ncbi:MAG: hypothetical protein RIS87_1300 [Pseudomonadota bacterium]
MNSLDEAFLEALKQLGFIFDSATENQLLKKNLKLLSVVLIFIL